ncbi:hypothetical protein MMPV_005627 [Pyropia vietnamensis]
MKVVRLSTLLNETAMNAAKLSGMSDALNKSQSALSTAKSLANSTADAVVGWDGVQRKCGTSTYPANTIYFFLIAEEDIVLNVSGESLGTIPTNQQAMLITSGRLICALVADKVTAPTPAPSTAPSPSPPVASPEPPVAPPQPSPTTSESPIGEPEPTGGEELFPSALPTDPTQTQDPLGTLEPTASPALDPVSAPDDGSACFPAAATLRRPDGEAVTMGSLRVGDEVAVGGGLHSRVYFFSHSDAAGVTSMVTLTTAGAGTLTVSADHLVYVMSLDGGHRRAVAADAVTLGDVLVSDRADGAASTVVAIGRARSMGLYAPHTHNGDLVVNGFVVSSYTRLLPPAIAHAVLAPVRAASAAGVLPYRLAQEGLWAGGATARRALDATVKAVRVAVSGASTKSDL